jgi:hypothetical protein
MKRRMSTTPQLIQAVVVGSPVRVNQTVPMATMHSAVKGNPSVSRFPIQGPSLTQAGSFLKVSSTAGSFDVANLHNYFGGRNPGIAGWGAGGYGSLSWNLVLTSGAFAGKPVTTTETGYVNDTTNAQAVPEQVSGKYLPRIFLEHWLAGIKRTYIYELVDLGAGMNDNGYGLLHSNFTPKPGFTAIKNVLGLLGGPWPGIQSRRTGLQDLRRQHQPAASAAAEAGRPILSGAVDRGTVLRHEYQAGDRGAGGECVAHLGQPAE